MEELKQLYEDYLALVAQLERDRKPFEGAFGLGGGPAAHPCHQQFAQDVEGAMSRVPQQELEEAVEYIFHKSLEYRDYPLVYWTFMAVHGATVPYLASLGKEKGKALAQWYEQTYPRRERMPCQQKVLSTLKKIR